MKIKTFIDEYKTEYDEKTLSYKAGEICEEGDITNQQAGAEETFAIGMPIYDVNGNEIGKLGIRLFENLNYHTPDFNIKIPVYFWFVENYKGKRQTIKTYYQKRFYQLRRINN